MRDLHFQTEHAQRRYMRGYPRLIVRFSRLDGGKIGEVTLTAKSPNKLELELGDDYVIFNRDQASELITSIQHFLALSRAGDECDSDDVVQEE